jgi:hypothetical protein
MMKRGLFFVIALLSLCRAGGAQEKPSIPEADRVRLAEAFRLNETVGDRIWPGWSKVPFAVLLVTPDYEFLVRHPQPSPDFKPLGHDPLLKSEVYFRKRVYPPGLQATFPAVQGSMTPTVVIGEAERTESKTSTPWVVTLFHEHFHQLQYTQPTYYAGVEALNLSRGEKNSMWMLNYAFPYDNKEVQEKFSALSKLLAEAVNAAGGEDRAAKLAAYLEARRQFREMLSPDDYKYLSFQLWQEGIARYTEYRVAELAAERYKPSQGFRALKDYATFAQVAQATRAGVIRQLLTVRLGASKREVVYPFGAAEGLLLDSVSPSWRSRYFADRFDLGRYYAPGDAANLSSRSGLRWAAARGLPSRAGRAAR